MSKKTINKEKTTLLSGAALNDSQNKTVRVLINRIIKHPLYHKRYIRSGKILAHTEKEVKKNQVVQLLEIRPKSRRKSWQVINILE